MSTFTHLLKAVLLESWNGSQLLGPCVVLFHAQVQSHAAACCVVAAVPIFVPIEGTGDVLGALKVQRKKPGLRLIFFF